MGRGNKLLVSCPMQYSLSSTTKISLGWVRLILVVKMCKAWLAFWRSPCPFPCLYQLREIDCTCRYLKLRDINGTPFLRHSFQHLLPIILTKFTHISKPDCPMRRGYSKPPRDIPCVCPGLWNSVGKEESGDSMEYIDTSELEGKVSPDSFLSS